MIKQKFYSMDEMVRLHEKAGLFFFSEGAMRFFDTKIVENSDIGNHFVTSEKFDRGYPRKFTIRSFDPETFQVDTVGDFQQYATAAQALKALKKIVKGGE